MPDCVACTKAKQLVIPFNQKGDREMLPEELMHVDVWGKYKVASINGYSYYLLLVDNASHYITGCTKDNELYDTPEHPRQNA